MKGSGQTFAMWPVELRPIGGYRDSLRDGNRCGGDISDLALEWVFRFPPLYPAGNSGINSPFEVELLTRFDDSK